jgi:hypothetical protein
MTESLVSDEPLERTTKSHTLLLTLGGLATLATTALAARLIWEETALTIQQGPQMIGFSLAHGYGAVLFFAPILLMLWLVIALVVLAISLWRKRRLSKWFWSTLASAAVVMAVLAIPPDFFQWLFISSFARSSHAADLMVYAAGEGHFRTARAYLAHGVPVDATDYEGSTLAYVAAARGSVPMLNFLALKGANFNAIDSYGDSPLEAAIYRHQSAAADFLKDHGAIRVKGTDEQRQAAIHAIVRKEIDRTNRLH